MVFGQASFGSFPVAPLSLLTDVTQPLPPRPNFRGRASPGTIVHFFIDGIADGRGYSDFAGLWSHPVERELSQGTHVFLAYSDDGMGNSSQTSEFSFLVGAPVSEDVLENPFPNPATLSRGDIVKFPFSLASDADVRLTIYDVLGGEEKTLDSGFLAAGTHQIQWDGRDSHGNMVGSGVYHIVLKKGPDTLRKSVTVLR